MLFSDSCAVCSWVEPWASDKAFGVAGGPGPVQPILSHAAAAFPSAELHLEDFFGLCLAHFSRVFHFCVRDDS